MSYAKSAKRRLKHAASIKTSQSNPLLSNVYPLPIKYRESNKKVFGFGFQVPNLSYGGWNKFKNETWHFAAKCFSRPVVQLTFNPAYLPISDVSEIGLFGEILSDKSVGALSPTNGKGGKNRFPPSITWLFWCVGRTLCRYPW